MFHCLLPKDDAKDSETSTEFVLNTTREVSSVTQEWYSVQPPRSCLKKYEDGLVACGNKETFFYFPSEDKWYRLKDMSFTARFPKA